MKEVKDRFMLKVYPEPNTGCWLWSGGQHPKGGHGTLNASSNLGFAYAHRLSYFLHKGDFDRSKMICHKCDVPWCVNPDHLYVGTAQENHRDMIERIDIKYAIGNDVPCAKLNPDTVRLIRTETDKGVSRRELGRRLGVSHTTICKVISGRYWNHVDR